MAVFFTRRGLAEPPSSIVEVTITGTGHSSYACVEIDGTTYTSAASGIEVVAGDVIAFTVYGYNTQNIGTVTIDGTEVYSVGSKRQGTYEWTVPEDISAVSITLAYTNGRLGTITVTTS